MKKAVLVILVILIGLGAYLYWRPVPKVMPVADITSAPKTQTINLPWPAAAQAALGASGYGLLASHGSTAPMPIASITKVITALAVLKQKPLSPGSQGPILTLDNTDLDFFNYYYLKDGSVANVTAGEQISEYQALETMLIPSANNMADSLGRWAFGSTGAYVTYANQMVKSLGLSQTTVGDTNGFSDATTSTADDLVKLGIIAMNNPTVAQIVSQSSAQVPVEGTINNVNWLLGSDGVVGIKTGNTDKAGGCFLWAAKRTIAGHNITLIGAVLQAPQLSDAINAADPLIKAAGSGFQEVNMVSKGQILGYYQAPWGAKAQFQSVKDLSLFAWKDTIIKISNQPTSLTAPFKAGMIIGNVTAQNNQLSASSPLQLTQDLPGPSFWWRLTHR